MNIAQNIRVNKIVKEEYTKSKKSNFYITETFTDEDISNIKLSYTDYLGNEIGFYFIHEEYKYEINDEDYKTLRKYISRLSLETEYSKLSEDYLTEKYKEWIEKSIKINLNESFLEYINLYYLDDIIDYEIIVPIHNLYTESSFKIGEVLICNITPSLIDLWFSDLDKENETIITSIKDFRKEHQGILAAVINVKAEKRKAMEIAYSDINDAFMVLRIFSISNLQINVRSYLELNSWKLSEVNHTLLVDKKRNKLLTTISEIVGNGKINCIENNVIDVLMNTSLSTFNELVSIKKKNNYQSKLYDSLSIYSKHTLQKEIYDKLLYVLVSVESLIIRNENESLTQNISERIAFTVGKSSEERKRIVKQIKDIYRIRSKYVHHGIRNSDNIKLLNDFLHTVWIFYSILVQNIYTFDHINQFLDLLDEKKYT